MPPLVLVALGVPVAVLPPNLPTRDRWARQWSRALSEATIDAAAVTIDKRSVDPRSDHDRVDYTLTSRVTLAALEETRGKQWSLHAAGLCDEQGRALALVAAAGTGKTTAARTLGAELGYLSDETVSIGPDLDVVAYPKPLSTVISADAPNAKAQHSPDELGLVRAPARATLRRIVVLRRDPDAEEVGLSRLTLSDALGHLIPQSSFIGSFSTPLLELTRIVRAVGGARLLTYAEIDRHVTQLRDLLALDGDDGNDGDGPEELVVHHPPPDAPATGPRGHLARARWDDAVELEDAIAILVNSTMYRLDHLGATVWRALSSTRSVEELAALVEEDHGPHPAADRLLADALRSLELAGVVHRF